MAQLISEIWSGLRDAGLPEVMLYLPDHTASRCHWDDTAVIGGVRVALLADQERKIVRVLPVDACTGIGVASPKGTDPSGYKAFVQVKLNERFGPAGAGAPAAGSAPESASLAAGPKEPPPAPLPAPAPTPPPVAVAEPPKAPAPAAKPDTTATRWGIPPKPATRFGGVPVSQK
jgi:hypothetical protein